jgi:hypothetical protein
MKRNFTNSKKSPVARSSFALTAKLNNIAVITLLILTLNFAFSPVYANENNWEFWTLTAVNTKLTKDLQAQLQKELRFKAGEMIYHDTGITFSQRINKQVSAGIGYRQAATKNRDDWEIEDRVYLTGTFRFNLKNFNITNRNRLEYRMYETGEQNTFRYRSRIRLSHPIESKINLDPFIANEVFFDLKPGHQSRFNRNRFYVGISAEPIKNFDIDLYYLNQASLSIRKPVETWSDKNILGLNMRYRF